eukprot:4101880-Prymnesium_polylepis.2
MQYGGAIQMAPSALHFYTVSHLLAPAMFRTPMLYEPFMHSPARRGRSQTGQQCTPLSRFAVHL